MKGRGSVIGFLRASSFIVFFHSLFLLVLCFRQTLVGYWLDIFNQFV